MMNNYFGMTAVNTLHFPTRCKPGFLLPVRLQRRYLVDTMRRSEEWHCVVFFFFHTTIINFIFVQGSHPRATLDLCETFISLC